MGETLSAQGKCPDAKLFSFSILKRIVMGETGITVYIAGSRQSAFSILKRIVMGETVAT